ncbi:UBC-like protein [Hesseltinella vesiculosa]|uniref:E2 ubiquitin-conjugating enzyme n=1 Tax=Hesseltinella vesiculosa TaxID=101127 RepID=A0A1X2GKT9_9FUNG|nr:UBC-like protein [Hesseltinella vesiculosa]
MTSRTELGSAVMKRIAKEIQALVQKPMDDIQVIPNDHDLRDIQAWIRGPADTPYEAGFFKIRLVLTDDFPQKPPKGYFMTKIFHPNVATNGEICVNTLKKDWKVDLGFAHVLMVIKCLLIEPNPESALNEEAGKLLLEEYQSYAKRARLYTNIHAKAGAKEYLQLEKDHPPASKTDLPTKRTEHVLTPSAVSNTISSPIDGKTPNTSANTNDRKRPLEETTEQRNKHIRLDENKKKLTLTDKKRTLRRL